MPFSTDDYVEFARELGNDPATVQTYIETSDLDPLPAVIQCAKEGGAITAQQAAQLSASVTRDRFADLVKPDDPPVLSAQDMRNVPKGAFIAFIFVDPPAGIAPHSPFRKGVRHLIHVMVSLGNGRAAGTKGQNIGLPVRTGNWEEVDLSSCLLWDNVPGTYDAIAESLGLGSPRHLRIRYRKIEDFQEAGTTASTSASASSDDLVSAADLRHYFDAEGWWHYRRPQDIRYEGWKLHVSCSVANAAQILDLALPILRQGNFGHKFLLRLSQVAEQNADPVQKGKVLAIYPDNIVEAFNIVGIIDAALDGHAHHADSPMIDDEIYVGNTVVYTRYGPFKGNWILNQAGTGYLPDPKGVTACPGWITNPWPNYPSQTGLNNLPAWPAHLLRYPGEAPRFFKKRLARQSP